MRAYLNYFTAVVLLTVTFIHGEAGEAKDEKINIKQSRYGYTPNAVKEKSGSAVKGLMIGPLGIHIDFDEDLSLLKVRSVEKSGPAHEKLMPGDYLISCMNKPFPKLGRYRLKKEESVIPRCAPVIMLADCIDKAEGSKSGRLQLVIKRRGKLQKASISLQKIGSYTAYYPFKCKKSRIIATRACDHIVKAFKQKAWGNKGIGGGAAGYETGLCGLALLAQSNRDRYMPTAHELARRLINLSTEELTKGEYLCNTYVTLFLCEYYFLTKSKPVKAKLEKIYKRYLDGAQPYGGWGHKYRGGIYGGGAYAISTGHVVMAMGLLSKIIPLDKKRTHHTMKHLCAPYSRGNIGYAGSWTVKPGKENVTSENLARGGEGVSRTGTTVLGMSLMGYDPYNIKPSMVAYLSDPMSYIAYFMPHCCHVIGQFPCTVAVARENPRAFRAHMDAEKWWYTLGRRYDGELLLGPIFKRVELRNDFQKKYGLLAANACVALIHSVDQRKLYIFRSIKPYVKLNDMEIYRKWNHWLITRQGDEPKRPASVYSFTPPKNFPNSVTAHNPRVKEQVDFKGQETIVIDAEILSGEWRQLLYLKEIKTGNLYWTVIQRGDDNCSDYRNGKLLIKSLTKSELKKQKRLKKEKKAFKKGKSSSDNSDEWKEASKEQSKEKSAIVDCIKSCKRVKVTLRASASSNPNGGWLRAHKLEFFDE